MYEPCFYGWFGKSSYNGDRKQTEVWEINRPLSSKLHPTMKPIELCSRGIKNSSKNGMIVLDIFLGSGSTLIACEQTNRICYGMEIDPIYCDVTIKRWEQYTKQKAEKLNA
jgi:DNA modification methylase